MQRTYQAIELGQVVLQYNIKLLKMQLHYEQEKRLKAIWILIIWIVVKIVFKKNRNMQLSEIKFIKGK